MRLFVSKRGVVDTNDGYSLIFIGYHRDMNCYIKLPNSRIFEKDYYKKVFYTFDTGKTTVFDKKSQPIASINWTTVNRLATKWKVNTRIKRSNRDVENWHRVRRELGMTVDEMPKINQFETTDPTPRQKLALKMLGKYHRQAQQAAHDERLKQGYLNG